MMLNRLQHGGHPHEHGAETVRKAVIAAAGLGTRMYPITKVIEKSMLPIGRRPAIDYIVRECMAAGVDEVAIVVRRGSEQIQRYYTDHSDLEALLLARGWQHKRHLLQETLSVPKITFIEQPLEDSYGTGVPALLAREFVDGDSFYFISGDDLLIDRSGKSSLAMLGGVAGKGYGIIGYRQPAEASDQYGYLGTEPFSDGLRLISLHEKLAIDARRSPGDVGLINISRYVFPSSFLDVLAEIGVHQESGEIRITDGLIEAMRLGAIVHVHVSDAEYFDIGDTAGLARAWESLANTQAERVDN